LVCQNNTWLSAKRKIGLIFLIGLNSSSQYSIFQ
jgi:hypothetical protein